MIDWRALEKALFVVLTVFTILFIWFLDTFLLQMASTLGMLYVLVRILNDNTVYRDLLLHNYRTMYERLLKDYHELKKNKLGGK